MQPYCNVLTVNIAQQGTVYALDGTDDRCSAGQAASARGMALLNANGTVGLGVTMIQPGGVPVHLEATIALPALNGTWRDSSGASGNFVLTPGAGIAGPQRLVAASGLPPASITSIQLAPGAVGAAAMAANAVTGANIVDASITVADFLDEPRAASAEAVASIPLTPVPSTLRQLTIVAPAAGRVIVNVSGWVAMNDLLTADFVICSIATDLTATQPYAFVAQERSAADYQFLPFNGTRGFSIAARSDDLQAALLWHGVRGRRVDDGELLCGILDWRCA